MLGAEGTGVASGRLKNSFTFLLTARGTAHNLACRCDRREVRVQFSGSAARPPEFQKLPGVPVTRPGLFVRPRISTDAHTITRKFFGCSPSRCNSEVAGKKMAARLGTAPVWDKRQRRAKRGAIPTRANPGNVLIGTQERADANPTGPELPQTSSFPLGVGGSFDPPESWKCGH